MEDLNFRKAKFGSNEIPKIHLKTLWELILACFDDPMLKALLVAAFVSIVIGVINDGWDVGWIEGSSIFFALFIIISVSAGTKYAKEKRFQKLQASEKQGQVILIYRDSNIMTKSTTDIVVGDIIKLESGKEIPADCILISGNNMTCNESSLTGETLDIVKRPLEQCLEKENPFLLG
jgi:magnesium-transporting ATPase (P-type)